MNKVFLMAVVLITTTSITAQGGGSFIQTPPGSIPSPQVYPGPPAKPQAYPVQHCIQNSFDESSHILRIFERARSVEMVVELPNGDKVYIVNGLPESREVKTSPHSTICYLGFRSNAALLIKSKMFNKWHVSMAPETSEKLPLGFSGKSKDGSEIIFRHGKAELIFSLKDGDFIFSNLQKL